MRRGGQGLNAWPEEIAMPVLMSRRAALAAALLAASGGAPRRARAQDAAFSALEWRHGGRLGVAVLDTGSGRRMAHRPDERFAMASTFKFLVAAFVLARCDKGEERLHRPIAFAQQDLVTYSPITETHIGEGGITMAELCEAAVTLSDNTAANLLLASFGGPAGLTAYVRSLGDDTTRLDRIETALRGASPRRRAQRRPRRGGSDRRRGVRDRILDATGRVLYTPRLSFRTKERGRRAWLSREPWARPSTVPQHQTGSRPCRAAAN